MSEVTPRHLWPLWTALAIGVATLVPRPDQAGPVARTPPWCVVCGELGMVDVVLNILLFVPFGAALRWRGHRVGRIALLSFGLSLAVELVQAAIPGRDPSLSDLLTNTAGGALGGMLAGWWPQLVRPERGAARLLAGAWAGLWLLQTALTAVMVRPSLPRTWYWGQLAPDLEQFDRFHGRVVSAAVGANRVRMGRLAASAEVRRALLAGEPLLGVATPGDRTSRIAPIVSIFDEQQREIVLVGRWGDDLVYRLRTGSVDLLLRPPAIRLPGVFANVDTALVEVSGRFEPAAAGFTVSWAGRGGTLERVVPLSAQWGWSLLMPFPHAHGVETPWLTAGWLIAWVFPMGYWARRYRTVALAGAAGALVIGLGVVPQLLGLRPGAVSEWLAGAVGLAVGAGLSARRRGAAAKERLP